MTLPAGAPWVEGLSMVCHELRRPLTVIRGAATLLMETFYRTLFAQRTLAAVVLTGSYEIGITRPDVQPLLARRMANHSRAGGR